MSLPLSTLTLVLTLASSFDGRFERIKGEATRQELYEFLYQLPKGGDLHNHLGGAGFPELWWRLANEPELTGGLSFRTRVRVSDCAPADTCSAPLLYFHTVRDTTWERFPACCQDEYEPLAELSPEARERWLSSIKLDAPGEARDEFFEKHWPRIGEVLDQARVLAEAAVENMKLFAGEGVRYVEFQIAPFGRRIGDRELTADEFHDVLVERLSREDARATGVGVRFQTNVLRFHPEAERMVEESYAFVDRHRDLWSSVNLVGREDNDKGYPLRFLDVFREMRRRYPRIGLSIHGGEVDEPNHHVRDTLLLGADRIGHGTNLITDPETLLLMRTGAFAVEVSLVSNHLLEYASDIRSHPFPEYLRLGIPVSLATDDRGMWDSNMTDEYFLAVTTFNLSWKEVVGLGRTSLELAFAPEETKETLVESYERDLQAFEARFGGDDWRERLGDRRAVPTGYARRHLLR